MFRRTSLQPPVFSPYPLIRRWLFVILVFIAIALVWVFYFTTQEYVGIGKARVSGFIYYKDRPQSNVEVSIGKENGVTDEDGSFTLSPLSFGWKTLTISKEHFLPKTKKVLIWKRNITFKKIKLERDPQYSAYFSGFVLDNFNKKPVKGALLTLGASTATTDSNGWFEFTDAAAGEAILKISALSFEDKTEEVVLNKGGEEKEYELTPYGRISFTSAREGMKNIYTINYDGTGLKNLTGETKTDCWGSHFTPDGGKIVFYSTLGGELNQWGQKIAYLYTMTSEGKALEQITTDVIPEGDFLISPDSQRVIFLGRGPGENIPDIYLAGIGRNKEWKQLTDNKIYESNLAISSDGSKILYSAFSEGMRDIYIIDINTYKKSQITRSNDYEFYPSFSPNNKEILYVRESYDFSSAIFVYNILTEEEKEIYKTSLAIKNVVWSKDEENIIFTSTRDNKTNIFVISRDGGKETKLTKESADYRDIIWPSLAKILVFTIHSPSGVRLATLDLSSRQIYELEDIAEDVISWAER